MKYHLSTDIVAYVSVVDVIIVIVVGRRTIKSLKIHKSVLPSLLPVPSRSYLFCYVSTSANILFVWNSMQVLLWNFYCHQFQFCPGFYFVLFPLCLGKLRWNCETVVFPMTFIMLLWNIWWQPKKLFLTVENTQLPYEPNKLL